MNAAIVLKDGPIAIDSPVARLLGFTSDKFYEDSYLWKTGPRVMVSFIASKQEGRGHLSALFAEIEDRGLRVAVPTPLGHMQAILTRKGFVRHVEEDKFMGPVDVWCKP